MNNEFIVDLVAEAKARGGGMILNLNDTPEVIVLTVEKYNALLAEKEDMNKDNPKKKILVTGGAGYIGTHVVHELLRSGYDVVVLDDLSTGKREHVPPPAKFVEGSVGDKNLVQDLLQTENFYGVIHLAASLEVEESVREPEKYFTNNVTNTEILLGCMKEANVQRLVFSSSAAVYGEQEAEKFNEKSPLRPNNPYGLTKVLGEKVIKYYCNYTGLQAIIFRYFNACGCGDGVTVSPTHESHLLPVIMEVAKGTRPFIVVNGGDYQTFDGSCVRDFVHVSDIARAHVLALQHFDSPSSCEVYNLGTGRGSSVKELVNMTAEVLNRIIPMEVGPRRAGDAPKTIADNSKIKTAWNFQPQHSGLEEIITSTWRLVQ